MHESTNRQRRHLSAKQKVAIVRQHLIDKVPVSDLCDEHGIQPTRFYQWQKQLFEQGAAVFDRKRACEGRSESAKDTLTACVFDPDNQVILPTRCHTSPRSEFRRFHTWRNAPASRFAGQFGRRKASRIQSMINGIYRQFFGTDFLEMDAIRIGTGDNKLGLTNFSSK